MATCNEFKKCADCADLSRECLRIAFLEMSRNMKQISLLVLGLCATTWASGCCWWCCNGYYSRYSDCDDGYVVSEGRHHRRHHRRHRDDDENRCVNGDGNCCNSCCCDGMAGAPTSGDGGAMMNGGCANCGTNQAFGGTAQNYGGMPFDPGAGWTVQSMTTSPAGNEPVLAPPSTPATPVTPGPARAQGWAPTVNPAPTPAQGLVPPPMSYNR